MKKLTLESQRKMAMFGRITFLVLACIGMFLAICFSLYMIYMTISGTPLKIFSIAENAIETNVGYYWEGSMYTIMLGIMGWAGFRHLQEKIDLKIYLQK